MNGIYLGCKSLAVWMPLDSNIQTTLIFKLYQYKSCFMRPLIESQGHNNLELFFMIVEFTWRTRVTCLFSLSWFRLEEWDVGSHWYHNSLPNPGQFLRPFHICHRLHGRLEEGLPCHGGASLHHSGPDHILLCLQVRQMHRLSLSKWVLKF